PSIFTRLIQVRDKDTKKRVKTKNRAHSRLRNSQFAYSGRPGSYQRSRLTLLISTERLFRKMAIIIARPTTASAAATASEKNTRICPSTFPKWLLNETNDKLTALSISSTLIKMTIAFLRISTPTIPILNKTALRAKYQSKLIILVGNGINFMLCYN